MPLKGNLLDPISDDRPCGESIRAKPVYDQIKEARREEDDLSQGEWRHERKVADYAQVLKLGQKVLAEQSKDLEIATWLTEALLNREGFTGLSEGLELISGLLETYWDKLYPRFDEEEFDPIDLASKLDFIGSQLNVAIKMQPITAGGVSWFDYDAAKKIPTQDDAYSSEEKAALRAAAEQDKKLLPEDFEKEFEATPKSFYADLLKTLETVFAALNRLDEICNERFDALDADERPSFYSIKQSLEEFNQTVRILLNRKRELEPDLEEEPEPEEEHEEPAYDSAAETEPTGSDFEPEKPARKKKAAGGPLTPDPVDEADAFARVMNSARYLRSLNPADPVPFLLLRALRWGELRRQGNGYLDLRQFDPPQTETRQQLKAASLDGDWATVLEVAENAAGDSCGRAWLDVQRYAMTALENLGYHVPVEALTSLLRGIVTDFPDLAAQTLMDDTPTANAETLAWLNTLFPPPADAEPAQASGYEPEPAYVPPAIGDADEEAAPGEPDLFEQAREMAARGNVGGAISLLSSTISTERSGRGRFLRRVQLAQICLSVGRPAMARNILDEVVKEVDNRKLEEWESSETLAQPLALYFQALGDSEEDQQRKRELYAKICRLDPSQALLFSPMD
ncbi:MAG: type VI secretion system protein TssA [Bryobacterales bacterium]|nr:type VI secretion system protein TssA [Bryobacterales bacterium]